LFDEFLRRHERLYEVARSSRCAAPVVPGKGGAAHTDKDCAVALRFQEQIAEARRAAPCSSGTSARQEPPSIASSSPLPLGNARALSNSEYPRSPLEVALELIARSGVWRSKEQYLATLFVLQPFQRLWQKAMAEGGTNGVPSPDRLAELARDIPARSVFLHGPGGSGKTYIMTEVVIPVVRQFFGHHGVKAIAPHNSAARLLLGQTMHSAGKMKREQSLKAGKLKPGSAAMKALRAEWEPTGLLLGDELSLAPPALLAGISRRAFHGRSRLRRMNADDMLAHPFGDVLFQGFCGDFLQLNPVLNHTLLEAFCSTRVPGVPPKTEPEDRDGFSLFRNICRNVILFSGTHRFLDEDLPALLEIMRTPGGAVVPEGLKERVLARVQTSDDDPRLHEDFGLEGQQGFFACGAHAAIQWEQVSRIMQLHVLRMARLSRGPEAYCNTPQGSPDCTGVPRARPVGQLVYYFQAVDRFNHPQDRQRHLEALRFVMNLSKSAGLHGMCPVYIGMRVRLTRKVLAPELVQEASGEVIDILFHKDERFGDPASSSIRPGDAHPCWERGWVVCDRLPLHVAVRWDECSDDYTGLDMPGVWHVAPQEDTWKMPATSIATIDHPGAPRPKVVKLKGRKGGSIQVTRCQVPLTHEDVATFQNMQGKTIRGPKPAQNPKGFVIDLFKSYNMSQPEYFQHLYMILGRARKLEWLVLRNFPRAADGTADWAIFENGPPAYICEFMEALEQLALRTLPRLLQAQQELGAPAWEELLPCPPDPSAVGRYLYDPSAWPVRTGGVCSAASHATAAPQLATPPAKRRRVRVAPVAPSSATGVGEALTGAAGEIHRTRVLS